MDICILASSSSGNCTAIRAGGRLVLLDAGLSGSEVDKRLKLVGWNISEISGVVLSHEHSDHVKGAGVLARRYGVPVYGTSGTLAGASSCWRGSERLREVRVGEPFELAGLRFEPFSIPHDVADPVQFVIRNERMSVGVATDLGKVTTLVAQKLATAEVAVIEANHDVQRLRWGSYPWDVKQRIASPHGHLNNAQAGELAMTLAQAGVKHIVLAHLSPNHNDKDLARREVSAVLAEAGLEPKLTVVGPSDTSVVIHQSSPVDRTTAGQATAPGGTP